MNPEKENKKGGQRLQKGGAKPKKPQKPKPQLTKKQKIQRGAYIAVTVVSAIIVILFIAYKLAFVRPNMPTGDQRPGYQQDPNKGDPANPVDDVPRNTDRKSPDFWTFLVAGISGGNTDVVMLASYDVTNQKLSVMNIPRDTMVNLPIDLKKINAVYGTAGGGEEGIEALKDHVSKTVGVYPDFYVLVEWEAVGKLAEAIGGVDFEVPFNMNYDDPTQNLHIHINAGMQHLDGEGVMKVLRYRDGNNGGGYREGDIGRIKTQQALLMAIAKKMLNPSIAGKIPDLVNIFVENVETDLTIPNLLWLGKAAVTGLDPDSVTFVTMPGNYNNYAWSRSTGSNQSYVTVNVDEMLELVNADFNPYKEDVTKADLDIMYKNKDGTIASTSGTVRDSKANPAWIAAKNAPKPTPTPEPDEDGESTDSPDESPAQSREPGESASSRPSGAGGTDAPDRGTPPPEASASPTPDGGEGGESPEPTPEPTPDPTPTPEPTPEPDPNAPPEGIPIF